MNACPLTGGRVGSRDAFLTFFLDLGLLGTAHGTEALLELVDAPLGVDELLLSREERVGVSGDTY